MYKIKRESSDSNSGSNNNNMSIGESIKRDINQQLIKYIYSTIDISKFKYEMIEYETDMSKFISGKYSLSGNFSGKNCFLVFTKLKSKFYSFLVDRKQLSYTFNKVNMDNVTILRCNAEVESSIYNGSIFDGTYIKKGDEHIFVITDIYSFKGSDYTNLNLDMKLLEITHYLESINSQIASQLNKESNNRINLELTVNKLYSLDQTKHFVNTIIPSYTDIQVRGLCFYPEKSGTKLIFMFSNGETKAPANIPYNNSNNSNNNSNGSMHGATQSDDSKKTRRLVKQVYMSSSDKPIHAILEMKLTDIVDIYNLFAVEKITDSGTVKLKKCKMDIAYISGIEKSAWCRDIINKSPKGSVFVKCIWRNDKKKWEPLEVNTQVKLPSLMDDIRKDLIEMEVSDSDSD